MFEVGHLVNFLIDVQKLPLLDFLNQGLQITSLIFSEGTGGVGIDREKCHCDLEHKGTVVVLHPSRSNLLDEDRQEDVERDGVLVQVVLILGMHCPLE